LLKVRQLEHDLTGFTGAWCGWWAGYQLDSATSWFGSWVESKLAETDEHTHRPKHTLDDLLGVKHAPKALSKTDLDRLIGAFNQRRG
jgi:hypothetical protein